MKKERVDEEDGENHEPEAKGNGIGHLCLQFRAAASAVPVPELGQTGWAGKRAGDDARSRLGLLAIRRDQEEIARRLHPADRGQDRVHRLLGVPG